MLRRWWASGGLLLAACVSSAPVSPDPTAAVPLDVTGTVEATVTDTDLPTRKTLRLWVPPAFEPKADTPAGEELLNQLQQFEQANSGIRVEVRVKRADGTGGMIDSLHTAMAAATGALPDIIAIDANNLDAATADDFIIALDTLVNPDIIADYYPFALESVRRNGSIMALPFASDALVAAYATTAYKAPPTTWEGVLESAFPVLVPANDPKSLYVVQQYLALGGTLRDRSDAVALNTNVLTELLDHYSAERAAGVLTKNTLDFGTGAETWSAYRELRAPLVITNAHSYLKDADTASNTGVGPAPTQSGKPYVLAEVWSYALVSKELARESGAWELLEWLTQPHNLGVWTLKAGYIPPRATAVESWPPEPRADFARKVLESAHPTPDAETLAILGPPIGKAVRNVIRGHSTTSAAVQDVMQELAAD